MTTELSPTDRINRALSEIRQGVAWLDRNGEKHMASERYQAFLISVVTRENVLREVHGYTGCVMESGRCEGEYACLACMPGIDGKSDGKYTAEHAPATEKPRNLTPADVLLGAGGNK